MGGDPIDLAGLDRTELAEILAGLGQPAYRATQLMDWLYGRAAEDLDRMTDLPRSLRQTLRDEGYTVGALRQVDRREAPDGTVKFVFALDDGVRVESVYIPEGPRRTVCLSTQAGCAMACAFCATGRGGLVRNLAAGEIIGQALRIRQLLDTRVTNVVAMGMGEPLANYEATVKALRLCGVDHGMGIAARHLAISTCGLPEGIVRLAAEGRQWQLTVSLHAGRDELRDRLMPINRRYPLATLHRACTEYCAATGRRITLAYVLIAGVNDGPDDARETAAFCRGLLAHVNLIPWNAVPGFPFAPPSARRIADFQRWLTERGVNATVRRPRGAEFDAACGQLRAARLEDAT